MVSVSTVYPAFESRRVYYEKRDQSSTKTAFGLAWPAAAPAEANDFVRRRLCTIVLNSLRTVHTGWYFGKTAGLLGTLDNEPGDDMLSSNGYLEPDLFKFTESWSLNENSCGAFAAGQRKPSPGAQIVDVCDSYFRHKTSPLFTCFSVVLENH